MLAAATLLTELQRFADPAASVFTGWPIARVDARRRWADAFARYVGDMAEVTPVLAPPAVTLVFSAVEDAFFATLDLVNATTAEAAVDFAGAWRAAIEAIAPGSPASDPTPTPFTFAAMDPIDVATREEALRAALVIAFRTGHATRRDDLDEIARAFHAATSGIRSTPTPFVVTYG